MGLTVPFVRSGRVLARTDRGGNVTYTFTCSAVPFSGFLTNLHDASGTTVRVPLLTQ